MRRGTYAALMLLLVVLGGALYSMQLRLDMEKGDRAAVEDFMHLPKAEYLKTASLGYEQCLADLLWLKAIQHIGERKISGEGYDWIYTALDTVTTLDPKFAVVYEVGGLALTMLADKVELSNKLLTKGVENNPDYWPLSFYLGFNYLFYMKDYGQAAKYVSIASKVPGSPDYLPLLASRLYVQAQDPAYALDFLIRMYDNTKDEKIKALMAVRIKMLRAQVTADALQKVVDAFKSMARRSPRNLDELVAAGMIDHVPEEPDGGRFYLDPDGKVTSSTLAATLGIYTKESFKIKRKK